MSIHQETADYDIFIIGGGINGCGIARDAAGRGYSVYLCEADDLASGTSSQSTKLIHGGLRYLEYYEFGLVREALSEREILWNIAPHLIHPLRFVLPHHKGLRPAWLLRLGLFIYDHLDISFNPNKPERKKLPKASTLNLTKDIAGECLQLDPTHSSSLFAPSRNRGFEYSDCAVDDSRLVVLNALDASEHGASINTQTKCVAMKRVNDVWKITVEDQLNKERKTVTAKVLINAAGPWVDDILSTLNPDDKINNIRLVQGSHIVVPKLYDHEKCYIFQNEDNRIIFAIPYHQDYTLIGTTDRDYSGDPRKVKITQEETDYLCASANAYFKRQINADDVVSTYAGVRSLYNDGASKAQAATRDYVLRVDQADNDRSAPLINIFGGKITTYRHLAESMMKKVEGLIGKRKKKWTEHAPLPGGNFEIDDLDNLYLFLQSKFSFLSADEAKRFIKSYGTKAYDVLDGARSLSDLGTSFSHGLYQKEVEYLIKTEWAQTADDILLRRTKLGLVFNQQERKVLEQWLESYFKALN